MLFHPARRLLSVAMRVAAWLFIAFTVGSVGHALYQRAPDFGGHYAMMSVTNNGTRITGVGLDYRGQVGAAIQVAEILLVLGALLATLQRRTWLRLLGHLVLIAWAALWLANLLWILKHDNGWTWRDEYLAITGVGLLATLWRAAHGWRGRPTPPPAR